MRENHCLGIPDGENGTAFMQSCQNKRRSALKKVLSCLTLALLLDASAAHAKELTFYVSPQGNDAWTGFLATGPVRKGEGPFATVGKALATARAERARNPATIINIRLRGGFYELAEPLVVRPEDSGASARQPLAIAAYKNEKPILSAGRRITGWKRAEGHTNLWSVELPDVHDGRWYFRQLWVNGERRQRARHPNSGYLHIAALPDATPSWENGHYRFQFTPDDLRDWPTATQGEIVAMTRWVESRMPVANIDAEKHIVSSSKKSVFQLQPNDPYYVEGVLEALDQPGEWYLDRARGTLYYWPLPGEKLAGFEAVAPRFAECVRIEGDPVAGKFVEHVRFEGITFSDTEWFFPQNFGSDERHISTTPDSEIYGFAQAAFGVPGAVRAEGARGCVFEHCAFSNDGGYGLQLGRGCHSNMVSRCVFTDLGAGGIKIGETHIRSNAAEQAGDNQITNCVIHDGGKMFQSGEGIWIGQSYGNRLTHNSISDFFYTAVSIGWTWGYGTSLASNNIVEFNHLHHIGQKANGDGPILSDMGGIYTLGRQPGTILRNNLIHDVRSFSYGGWGLYTDEGSSGILLENNVVYGCKNAGFHQHYGRENILRNNIFAFNTEHQLMRSRAEPHVSFIFTNNIVLFDSGDLLGSDWQGGQFVMDRNLYFDTRSAGANLLKFAGMAFADWQKWGHDTNSVIADPGFVEANQRDFRLKKDGLASRFGFKVMDVREAGARGR